MERAAGTRGFYPPYVFSYSDIISRTPCVVCTQYHHVRLRGLVGYWLLLTRCDKFVGL